MDMFEAFVNTDLLQAQDLQKRLLTGQRIEEEVVRPVFYDLAKQRLTPYGLSAFNTINHFYNKLCHESDDYHKKQLLADSNQIAFHLMKLPFVQAILPAGQFYCDMYDPLNRRFLGFMKDVVDNSEEIHFTEKDLPDYDFLSIYSQDGKNPWSLRPTPLLEREQDFERMVYKNPEIWQQIVADLKTVGADNYPVGFIKLTGKGGLTPEQSRKRVDGLIADYLEKKEIALCFHNNIPLVLWNNLDRLVRSEDFQILSCIRDLIIGIDNPLYANAAIRTDIPQLFQINYALRLISEHGPLYLPDILDYAFDNVAKTMPERPLHRASTGLFDFSLRHWKDSLQTAQQSGLIIIADDGLINLTDQGNKHLGIILKQREVFLKREVLL